MLKLGIVRYDGLDRPYTWVGKRKRCSVLLLKELFQKGPEESRMHGLVVRSLITANGTWKETQAGRFSELDKTVLDLLRERSRGQKLTVADLGVSNGVTSIEFYKTLSSAFPVDFVATDLWHQVIAFRSIQSGWIVVLDSDGHPLQFVIGPFVLPAQGRESMIYPINWILRQLCRWTIYPRASVAFGKYHPSAHRDFETISMDSCEITKLPLLSPEVRLLIKTTETFKFLHADIMQPLPLRRDVIRAMNILTRTYFDDASLRKGLHNCLSALKPNGILILGQSPVDGQKEADATVYARERGEICPILRMNEGCGLDDLVREVQRTD